MFGSAPTNEQRRCDSIDAMRVRRPMMPRAGMVGEPAHTRLMEGSASGYTSTPDAATVDQRRFYAEYHGHPPEQLETVVRSLRDQGKQLIWLAGDSSLDNKYWFHESSPALNGYEHILSPAVMKQDVSYWLNATAAERAHQGGDGPPLACVNTAIEATSLNDRACSKLWAQDELIRQHIGPEDILIVSVGGNDVALQPLLCTVLSMFAMVYVPLPTCFIKNYACACPPNLGDTLDCGCLCCGVPNCLSSLLCGFPFGFPYEPIRIRTLRPATSRLLSWHCMACAIDTW